MKEHKHCDGKECAHEYDECACGGCCGEHNHASEGKSEVKKLIISAAVFIFGIILSYTPVFNLMKTTEAVKEIIIITLFALSVIISAGEYIVSGAKNIIKFNFNETVLMLIAAAASFILGEYAEGAAVMLLFSAGEEIEHYASSKSKKAINSLLSLQSEYANIFTNGGYVRIKAEQLKKGDKILIKPGEKIPGDCRIVGGSGFVENSSVTGESKPVSAAAGDEILSGCINLSSPLECVVINDYKDSTAVKIAEVVKEAAAKKSRANKFITKFAKIYTPCVIILSAATAVFPPLIFNMGFEVWIKRALVLLVASCPCAVVISVPLSFFAGIGRASRSGVLIRGSLYIERLAKIKNVAFDKTGTLTEGKMKVDKTEIFSSELDKDSLLAAAGVLESVSNHPVAKAVCEYAKQNVPDGLFKEYEAKITGINEIPGIGVSAYLDGSEILCVGGKYIEQHNIPVSENGGALSVCYIITGNKAMCALYLSDVIRSDAEEAVKTLKNKNIGVYMLTGDRRDYALDISKKAGISKENVYADLMPQDKSEKIREIGMSGVSAFVGDGINDAAVLTGADVGIAMASGSDIASGNADVVLVNNKLSSVYKAVKISKRTMNTVKLNIAFALLTKLAVFALGIFGLAPIWLAVFADAGVCIITVLIATAVLKTKL